MGSALADPGNSPDLRFEAQSCLEFWGVLVARVHRLGPHVRVALIHIPQYVDVPVRGRRY